MCLPVRTLLTPLALSLDPEGANMGPVSLVVGGVPGQLGQELVLVTGHLAQSSCGPMVVRILGQLRVDVLNVVLAVHIAPRKVVLHFKGGITDLFKKYSGKV